MRLFGARAAALACGLLTLVLLSQCGAETFDLLEKPGPDAALSVAGGAGQNGAGSSGQNGGGSAGQNGGGSAGPNGGGRDGGSLPDSGGPSPCGFTPCPDAGFECPPDTQYCLSCVTQQECKHLEEPFCDQASHLCVECLDDIDCNQGFKCNRITKRCDRACISGNDCSTSQHPLCDPSQGVCVDCTGDPHCRAQPSKPFCWVGQCVECYNDAGCAPSGTCVAFQCQRR